MERVPTSLITPPFGRSIPGSRHSTGFSTSFQLAWDVGEISEMDQESSAYEKRIVARTWHPDKAKLNI